MTLQLSYSQIASNVFGLSHNIFHCTRSTFLDELSNAILLDRDFDQGSDAAREREADQVGSNFTHLVESLMSHCASQYAFPA